MDFVTILIYLSEIIIVLSLLMILGFGLRTLIGGRKNYIGIASMALAVVVFVILYVTVDADGYAPINGNPVTQGEAAIVITGVVLLGLAMLALVGSALRGLIR